MSNDFLTVAEELEALLQSSPAPAAPHIDESYLVAAKPVESPEAQAATEDETLIPELVRNIVDYAVRSAPSGATAANIGEAIGAGVEEAVHQLRLDDRKVAEAVDTFLYDLGRSVRAKLRME